MSLGLVPLKPVRRERLHDQHAALYSDACRPPGSTFGNAAQNFSKEDEVLGLCSHDSRCGNFLRGDQCKCLSNEFLNNTVDPTVVRADFSRRHVDDNGILTSGCGYNHRWKYPGGRISL
jgi:hypothetical protein